MMTIDDSEAKGEREDRKAALLRTVATISNPVLRAEKEAELGRVLDRVAGGSEAAPQVGRLAAVAARGYGAAAVAARSGGELGRLWSEACGEIDVRAREIGLDAELTRTRYAMAAEGRAGAGAEAIWRRDELERIARAASTDGTDAAPTLGTAERIRAGFHQDVARRVDAARSAMERAHGREAAHRREAGHERDAAYAL